MSQTTRTGVLTVLVFLTGCQADPELEHPGSFAHRAFTRAPAPAVVTQDAGTPDGGRDVDQLAYDASVTPSAPVQTRLPTVHVALKNASSQTIWHGGPTGCTDTWAGLRPAQPTPAPASEAEALADARSELGCICDCATLDANEVCRREKCPEMYACTAAFWSAPIAAGKTLEGDVAPFTTKFDTARKCLARVAYAAGTKMLATFCYLSSESSLFYICDHVPFQMGDTSVTYEVKDAPADAGT